MRAMPQRSIGFAVGKQLAISSHGSLGFALSSCRDLSECFQLISRYEQTRAEFFDLHLAESQSGQLVLSVVQRHEWGTVALPLYETLLVCIQEILQYMIGAATGECRVRLPYSAPLWAEDYHTLGFAQLDFEAADFSLALDERLLSMPSISFDAKTLERAKQQCERELRQLKNRQSLAQAVRDYLDETGNYATNIDEIARHFSISTSTLIRRLKQENTSHKAIIESLRKQLAIDLLEDNARSIESIALQLGYSDVSNFSRSFKRWFGCAPGSYRSSAH